MGRWFGRKKDVEKKEVPKKEVVEQKKRSELDIYEEMGITTDVSREEFELISVIASSIMAGSQKDSKWKVNRILKMDKEKESVVAIVAAVAAGDYPNSKFRLRKIEKV